jgi:hypothetical protein
MKKLLTLALALVVLAVFTGLGAAQEERRKPGGGKPPPPDVRMKQPVPSSKQLTGKVTQVDAKAKTFTVMSKGQAVTFSAATLPALPKAGEIIDITYTQTPGGPMNATTVRSSKSNSDIY